MSLYTGSVEIKRTEDTQQFYFVVKAKNGEVLCTSEMYTQKHNAVEGANALSNAMLHTRFIDLTT